MLRCVLLFAVSSHSVVNSVTVKAGSNTPKLNDPLVVRGWRADGILGMARTPEKAEKALGVKVAPNNDLYNANDFQKYNGRSFVVKSLKSTDTFPKPYLQVMRIIVWCGNRVGKKTKFTFYKGGSQEENLLSILLGPFPYATGGYVSKAESITYSRENSLNIFGKSYGTLKLDPSCTKDYIVWSCADTYVPGPPCCTGYAYQPHACCTY